MEVSDDVVARIAADLYLAFNATRNSVIGLDPALKIRGLKDKDPIREYTNGYEAVLSDLKKILKGSSAPG